MLSSLDRGASFRSFPGLWSKRKSIDFLMDLPLKMLEACVSVSVRLARPLLPALGSSLALLGTHISVSDSSIHQMCMFPALGVFWWRRQTGISSCEAFTLGASRDYPCFFELGFQDDWLIVLDLCALPVAVRFDQKPFPPSWVSVLVCVPSVIASNVVPTYWMAPLTVGCPFPCYKGLLIRISLLEP